MVLGDDLDHLDNKTNFLPVPEIENLFFGRPSRRIVTLPVHRQFPKCASRRNGIFQKVVFCLNLCVFFQTATKLSGQIVITLFEPNCLTSGSVTYCFWPGGAVKKLLRHQGRREPSKFGHGWVTLSCLPSL